MANWNQPALTDTYANFLAFLNAKLTDSALGLDPAHTTVTNPPANSIRYNSASNRWEKFVSGSWGALSALYAINISGNAGTATTLANTRTINGVNFNGSANITVTANTTQALTFNNGGSGVASGTTFDGATARTISYNSVGAPSTTGANASGTWAISVTGNAATATNATTAASCTGNSATVTNGVYTTGDQTIGGNKTLTGLTTFTNGRVQVQSAGTAMLEMHIPGVHARGWYLDSSGITRLSTTNGGGVAQTALISIDASGNTSVAGNLSSSGNIVSSGSVTGTNLFGQSQTWQTTTLANNVTYTNTTGRAVAITARANGTGSFGHNDQIYVNGNMIMYSYFDAAVVGMTYFFIVPNGSTYSVNFGTGVAAAWMMRS